MTGNASILYQVAVEVAPEIRDAYLDWLHPHAEAILALDGFLGAEIFIDAENENVIVGHYRLRDMAAMDAYLAGPAQEMRADGIRRFGDKMSAHRRILKVFDHNTSHGRQEGDG